MFNKNSFRYVLCIALFIVNVGSYAKEEKPFIQGELTVATSSGLVIGMQEGPVRTFLGIPYAAPPVGDLRWKAPQPVKPWVEPLQATTVGPACHQPERASDPMEMGLSEDCLSMNIWTKAKSAEEKLPVIFWIHGGGYKRGSGAEFVGKHLAELGHVVVTFNYRLNIFGFLGHKKLTNENHHYPTSGNYGLMDQQLALDWVRQNVGNFGGDWNNITLMGESAGGGSVCAHMVAPASQGKFHKAIMQSGPCDLNIPLAYGEKTGEKVAGKLGCNQEQDTLACMRNKTPEELLAVGMSFYPLVDGFILPDGLSKLLAKGDFAKVPVLLGTNKDEHSRQTLYFGGDEMVNLDEAGYEKVINSTFSATNIDPAAVLKQYPSSNYKSPGWAYATVLGEYYFSCIIRRAARDFASKNPVYLYRLTYERPTFMGDVGAYHTEDLEFVFHETTRRGLQLKEHEKDFSRKIMGYWSRFSKTSNPNGKGAVKWPVYQGAGGEYLDFVDLDTIKVKKGMLPQCDFWDQWAVR